MTSIIDKLSEIENVASRIKESASMQKQTLTAQMQAETKAFDADMDERIRLQVVEIKRKQEVHIEEELAVLREKSARWLTDMEDYYNKNHEQLAQELFAKIIGM